MAEKKEIFGMVNAERIMKLARQAWDELPRDTAYYTTAELELGLLAQGFMRRGPSDDPYAWMMEPDWSAFMDRPIPPNNLRFGDATLEDLKAALVWLGREREAHVKLANLSKLAVELMVQSN